MELSDRSIMDADNTDIALLTAEAHAKLARGELVHDHVALQLERRLLRADLAEARAELDRLIYAASHDLRAPLRGIAHLSAWIEEDLDGLADAGDRTAISANFGLLLRRVRRLELLVEGLLEYSRAGRGRYDTAPETADDAAAPAAPAALAREFLGAPGHHLSPEVAERVELITGPGGDEPLSEPTALRVIITHLVANAARHGRDGPIRVTVSSRDLGDDAHVEVTVADDGRGIDARYHRRIFDLFQTLESRDHTEGAGIGLAVVERLVTRLGGTISLESAPGEGAAFSFTWPSTPHTAH